MRNKDLFDIRELQKLILNEKNKKALKDVGQESFDGHSDFQKLSPRQKLEWLSELIYFKSLVKKSNFDCGIRPKTGFSLCEINTG